MYHKDSLKHLTRPKKGAAAKRRRQAVQKKRLVSLGVPADKVVKMQPNEVRAMLHRPAKIKKVAKA